MGEGERGRERGREGGREGGRERGRDDLANIQPKLYKNKVFERVQSDKSLTMKGLLITIHQMGKEALILILHSPYTASHYTTQHTLYRVLQVTI